MAPKPAPKPLEGPSDPPVLIPVLQDECSFWLTRYLAWPPTCAVANAQQRTVHLTVIETAYAFGRLCHLASFNRAVLAAAQCVVHSLRDLQMPESILATIAHP